MSRLGNIIVRLDKALRKFGLKTKITGATIFVIVLTAVVGSGFFYARTKAIIFDNLQKRGMTICENLGHSAKYGVLTEDTVILNELVEGVMQNEDVVYVVIQNEQGETLAEKAIIEVPQINKLKEKARNSRRSEMTFITDAHDWPVYNFSCPVLAKKVSLTETGGIEPGSGKDVSPQLRGTVQVGISITNVLNKLRSILRGIIVLTTIIIGIGVICSLGFVRIIMKPIEEIAGVAAKIASGDLSHTANVDSQDEIGQFARQFNVMAEAVKRHTQEMTKEIAERRRAEDILEKLNKELKAMTEKLMVSNRGLREFAHIVAHDLKSPLRAIGILAHMLSADYADRLDEEGQKRFETLIGRTERMSNMIDGILQYVEIKQSKQKEIKIELNALLSEIISSSIKPPANIEIAVENELPVVVCERTYITEVFRNLISNAVKYMDKAEGKITVGCSEETEYWKFHVADNGPGIDEKYFEKIFQIFQTLSPRDQIETTGISLSIVKKIVEMYNGKIWVESKVGSGSTFYFTLPKEMVTANERTGANTAC